MNKPIPTTTPNLAQRPPASDLERYLAAAMHVGEIFFPILAPAIAYAIAGRSKFLKSHAYQALFETIALNVCLFVVGAISLAYTVISLWNGYHHNWEGFSWWKLLIRFAIGWILLGILELVNTAVSLRQAYKAFLGEWPKREIRRFRSTLNA